MAATGQIDPAFLLTMAKAHSGVKESDYTKEEVKDVMFHLYKKAKEAAARDLPKEVRILKHLLTIKEPQPRRDAMELAFQQGAELTTKDEDFLVTRPNLLLAVLDTVLEAYETQAGKVYETGKTSMVGQAAELMHPQVIERMRSLKAELIKHFL